MLWRSVLMTFALPGFRISTTWDWLARCWPHCLLAHRRWCCRRSTLSDRQSNGCTRSQTYAARSPLSQLRLRAMREPREDPQNGWTSILRPGAPLRMALSRFVRTRSGASSRRLCRPGFDPSAMAPCYGLAEATLVVSMSRPWKPVSFGGFDRILLSSRYRTGIRRRRRRDVGWMRAAGHGTDIAIVDPVTRSPPSRRTRWARSGFEARASRVVTTIRTPDLSDCFNVRIDDEQGLFLQNRRPWIYSQRRIVRDRPDERYHHRPWTEHHPQDIELTAQEAHPELRANRGVAFGSVVEKRKPW